MAGIGVRLSKIYDKQTLLAHIAGFTYSTVVTIAPMILVIVDILIMGWLLGYSELGYTDRELFSCTVLYIFIFSLLSASPFNAVLSRYMSDVIYDEKYEEIMPSFYTGLIINTIFSCIFAVPFCIAEFLIGHVDPIFVLISFCGFIGLLFVFYTMLYLSICKDYSKITRFYFIGLIIALLCSLLFVKVMHMDIIYGMMLALDIGFLIIGTLEFAQIRNYFKSNSRNYKRVLPYFRKFWPLIVSNFLYTAGLYVHNFVFWTTDLRIVVANVFVCAEPYDMATFLALATNLTSSVIFISNVELRFHDRYKKYSESVIGGRLIDIENAKIRMFRQLSMELMSLVRIQFIISVVLFLIFSVFLPLFGFSGLVMQIYPCLAAGYFILFTMYASLLFLYYYNDLSGGVIMTVIFFLTTLICSIFATRLDPLWYGSGLLVGSFAGWGYSYFRLRWVERNIDRHIFCNGTLLKKGKGKVPSARVYVKRGVK